MMRPLKHALLALGAVMIAAPAFADTDRVVRRIEVSYADLDIATKKGAEALYRRIDRAARKACQDRGRRGLDAQRHERDCRIAAIDQAIVTASLNQLDAVYADAGVESSLRLSSAE